MKSRFVVCFLFCILAISGFLGTAWQTPRTIISRTLSIHHDIPVPMSDGVLLSTDLYRPTTRDRVPTILVRTPYNKQSAAEPTWPNIAHLFAAHGFAVVIQDVRGKYASEGHFYPHRHECKDGEDTVAWIEQQPWSDGQVACLGVSYVGGTAWQAAAATSTRAVKALLPWFSCSEAYSGWYDRGVPNLKLLVYWMCAHSGHTASKLPHVEIDQAMLDATEIDELDVTLKGHIIEAYRDFLQHPHPDAFWQELAAPARDLSEDIPVLMGTGWYDQFIATTLQEFCDLQQAPQGSLKQQSRLIIGPWTHALVTHPADFIPGSEFLVQLTTMIHWCRQHMLGAEPLDLAPVTYYLMGRNIWKEAESWPPPTAMCTYYPTSDMRLAQTAPSTHRLSHYFNPMNFPPAIGGHMIYGDGLEGPQDQQYLLKREDVILFTSEPLEAALDVVGKAQVHLKLDAELAGLDLALKLIDHAPDGSMRLVTTGFSRFDANDWHSHPVTVALLDTAFCFQPGHRIQLALTHSDFPSHNKNPFLQMLDEGSLEIVSGHHTRLELPVLTER